METKAFKFELKDLIEETGEFEALISTKKIDSHRDKVLPTAFTRTIKNNSGKFPILFFHDPTKPVGSSTKMVIEEKGVRAFGRIDLSTELGRQVMSGMKFDPPYIDRTSIGFTIPEGGDTFDKRSNVRTIKELKLMEFSLITRNFASNSGALIESVKSEESNNIFYFPLKYFIVKKIDELEEKVKSLEHLADPPESTQPDTSHSVEDTTVEEEKSVSEDTAEDETSQKNKDEPTESNEDFFLLLKDMKNYLDKRSVKDGTKTNV